MAAPLELGRLYQLGYVTSDMAQAIDYAERMFGVAGFRDYGELESEVAAGRARIRVAQGAIGGTVFELIEPLGGADKVYRDHLPARGFAIRLHHLAYYLDDPEAWRRFNRAVDALGITVAIRGTSPSSEYVYVDLRSELGHYAEVVHRFGAEGLDAEGERRRVELAIAQMRGGGPDRSSAGPP